MNAQSNFETLTRCMLFLIVGVICFFPELAHAEVPWVSGPQKIINAVNSGLGRSIAIIAVMALGFAALAKKMSWGWALSVIAGIVLIFGAAAAVDFFGGTS